jgi:hypothetical protein
MGPPLKIFFSIYFDHFNVVFRLRRPAAVAHGISRTQPPWAQDGWAYRRDARRIVLNRVGHGGWRPARWARGH